MRNIGPFTIRFFVNQLLAAGILALLAGLALLAAFVMQVMPKLHWLFDGMLTIPLLIVVGIVCLLLWLLGTLHIGLAVVLGGMASLVKEAADAEEMEEETGLSELHRAVAAKDAAAVKRLLDAGACAESATEAGRSALLLASEAGNPEVVRLLLAGGALVDGRANYGLKPLDAAVRCGHLEVVRLLIEAGATVGRGGLGRNHQRIAKIWGHKDVARYLKGLETPSVAPEAVPVPVPEPVPVPVATPEPAPEGSAQEEVGAPEGSGETPLNAASDLSALLKPKHAADKALTAAFWLQVCQQRESFSVEQLVETLKEMHMVLRDPAAMIKKLTAGDAPLLETIQKSPRGKKTYRLSEEAIGGVSQALAAALQQS